MLYFSLENTRQYICPGYHECQVLGGRFGDLVSTHLPLPRSSDISPCNHLALSPVQTALGMRPMRGRPYSASVPTVRRETAPPPARNRPISSLSPKIVSILTSPSSPLVFFFLFYSYPFAGSTYTGPLTRFQPRNRVLFPGTTHLSLPLASTTLQLHPQAASNAVQYHVSTAS